jgi:hypothetical protein
MRFTTAALAFLVLSLSHISHAADAPALPVVTKVEQQPLVSQVERLVESLDFLGTPLSKPDRDALKAAMIDADADKAVAGIQKVLDPYCLVGVELRSEKELTVQVGSVKTGVLRATSPNAQRLAGSPAADVKNRWLDLQTFDRQPLKPQLSGLKLEYRIIQLYSRDAGPRDAALSMEYVVRGGVPQRGDARGEPEVVTKGKLVNIAFDCSPSHVVTFRVVDESGKRFNRRFIEAIARP